MSYLCGANECQSNNYAPNSFKNSDKTGEHDPIADFGVHVRIGLGVNFHAGKK